MRRVICAREGAVSVEDIVNEQIGGNDTATLSMRGRSNEGRWGN